MDALETIAELSREFGGPDYVLGGGGNTSCKDRTTLWIKPSGTKVADMTPGSFVAMDRGKIAELHTMPPPEGDVERERVMKETMLAAVLPGSKGRPSVEAPVHNLFEATFAVHVHPPLVNGLTCAAGGREKAAELFPQAPWVEYSAGFMLNRVVKKRLAEFAAEHGREASVVLMENHGIIVAADEPEDLRRELRSVMGTLEKEYDNSGVATALDIGPAPSEEYARRIGAMIRESAGGADAAGVTWSGPFVGFRGDARGAVTPDHIVYAKAWYLVLGPAVGSGVHGEPPKDAVAGFRENRGYPPRVVVTPEAVFGIGPNEDTARLALEFARDAALVKQLAAAFGGIRYLEDKWSDFIENWEVEAYRRKLAREGKA